MKNKSTVYILLFFVGVFGGHYLYLEKPVSFLVRLLTLNFLLFGWFYDLYRVGKLVDIHNSTFEELYAQQPNQVITTNKTEATESKRYEHKTYTNKGLLNFMRGNTDKKLNELGREGWELVHVKGHYHYLRREIK